MSRDGDGMNGWDLLRDNNRSKSVGAQLSLSPVSPRQSVLNWIGGQRSRTTITHRRDVFDLILMLKPTEARHAG